MPLILKFDKNNVMCVSCEQKSNGLLQPRSKDSIQHAIVILAIIIHHNISHKLLLKQPNAFGNFSQVLLHNEH